MAVMHTDKLNEIAMQVILHAGDARTYCNEAIEALCQDREDVFLEKMEVAKREITIAHNLQTETIQETITCEEQPVTLLFVHAQDTLMTINSEITMAGNMYKLYCKLQKKEG